MLPLGELSENCHTILGEGNPFSDTDKAEPYMCSFIAIEEKLVNDVIVFIHLTGSLFIWMMNCDILPKILFRVYLLTSQTGGKMSYLALPTSSFGK